MIARPRLLLTSLTVMIALVLAGGLWLATTRVPDRRSELGRALDRTAFDHLGAGRIEAAMSILERSVELSPGSAVTLNNLATTQIAAEQYEEAIRTLDRALELEPEFREAHANKSLARSWIGEASLAVSEVNELLKGGRRTLRGAAMATVGTGCGFAVPVDPGETVADSLLLQNRALASAQMDAWTSALRTADQAVSLAPLQPEGYLARAWIRFWHGLGPGGTAAFEEALADASKLIELAPDSWCSYNLRGVMLSMTGEDGAAIRDYDRAIELRPSEDSELYSNRAISYWWVNDYDSAIVDLDTAIELDPDSLDAHMTRGSILAELGFLEEARADLDKAVDLSRDQGAGYLARGHLHLNRADASAALHDFNRALADPWLSEGDEAWAQVGRGFGFLQIGNPEMALQAFQQAEELAMQWELHEAWTHVGIGWAAVRLGRYEQAVERLTLALDSPLEVWEAHYARAHANLGLRRTDVAIEDLARALTLVPEGERAELIRGQLEMLRGRSRDSAPDPEDLVPLRDIPISPVIQPPPAPRLTEPPTTS